MDIRLENDKAYKYEFVKKVLTDLPEWFEFEEAILTYADMAKSLATYVVSEDGRDLGFIIIKETSDEAIEIYCLGLFKDYRGRGFGKFLVGKVLDLYRYSHSFAQVKTLDEGLDKYYDETIGFYRTLGFMKLETIKEIWGEDNPCMIMIKSL